MAAYKPVGVNEDSLFPPRVMSALDERYMFDPMGLVDVDKDFPKLTGDKGDSPRIQRAVDHAIAEGLGGIFLSPRRYSFTSSVVVKGDLRGFTIRGIRGKTIIWRDPADGPGASRGISVTGSDGPIENVLIEGLSFDCGLLNEQDFMSVRMRRTDSVTSFDVSDNSSLTAVWSSSRINWGVRINGNRNRPTTAHPVKNAVIRDCDIYGSYSLPFAFYGVHGIARMEDCFVRRCYDTGWVDSEHCQAFNNLVEYSQDNGLSLSRGAATVMARGNTCTDSWFNGIWGAGFASEVQRGHIVIEGNYVRGSSENGIYVTDCDSNAVMIVNNEVIETLVRYRGSTSGGVGIYVSNGKAAGTLRDVMISNNLVRSADRAGIIVVSAARVAINGNLLDRIALNTFKGNSKALTPGPTNLVGICSWGTPVASWRRTIIGNVIVNFTPDRQYAIAATTSESTTEVIGNSVTGFLNKVGYSLGS